MDVSGTIGVNGDGGPKQAPPPPSPVTGCYLLIVVGEPYSEEHKDIILQRIAKGLLSWDTGACQVDLEKELQTITAVAPEGEETRHGERLIQFASENLVTEILIHPATSTLIQCMKNLLSSFTRHRHIIHSGYTFAGNGSWALQDGTFSLADFSEAFQEIEVQRVLRAYENTISIDIHCSAEGDWTKLPKEQFTKFCKIRVNPDDVLTSGSPSINTFLNYISPYLVPAEIENLLESSDVVGNIRFSHPTLYVFPGGQGDAALFGINGFNMLVDGGFARKACFWDFTRHLDRLDAVLMTRINNTNVSGISSVLRRKVNNQVYPQIGHFFCNLQERKANSPDGDKDKDPLLINLLDEGHEIVSNLKQLNLRPQICYRDTEPINLYHKVGHGTLDMYVLSPAKDSREVKEFIQKWNMNDQKLFSSKKDAKDFIFPLQNMVSICALLVWQPASPTDTITRLLFPGSTPHNKIFEGLDRLKHLEFMKHPVCTAKTLTPSGSILGLKARQTKGSTVLDKIAPPEKPNKISDNKQQKEKTPPLAENKSKPENKTSPTENKNKINGTTNGETPTGVTKRDSVESEKSDTTDAKKTVNENKNVNSAPVVPENKSDTKVTKEVKKENDKPKAEPKPKITNKTRSESLARKTQDKKPKPIEKKTEQKPSPKKTVDTKVNGTDKPAKEPAKPKLMTKSATKSSPTSTPAKSTKDANNRKVIESKKTAPKKEAPKPAEKKEAPKVERKPISRRPKQASPGRGTKSTESPTKKIVPKDKNGVTRTIKLDKEGTTDSSAVSTPSADQDTMKKIDESKLSKTEIDELRAKELADLKEEQEVVKEIEAVFQKDEEKKAVNVPEQTDLRKIKNVSLEEKTTEPEDEEEEYLIIEKEEVEQYTEDSINEAASGAKAEDEIQKHKRDSEESEKPKVEEKPSDEPKDEKHQPELMKADTCEVLEIVPPKEDEAPIPPEMTRSKEDSHKTEEMSKEVSVTSPEDKYTSSEKKTTDTRDEIEQEIEEGGEEGEIKPQERVPESQPDEKFSTTVESGATTAPTLPEDERIPLDEIKEDIADQVIEEKYVKEETKEKEVPVVVLPQKVEPPKMAPVAGMKFDAHQQHIRDIVKTPDEVADLPVHEEVDIDYEYPGKKDETKKIEEPKEVAHEDKETTKPEECKVEKEDAKITKEETKTEVKEIEEQVAPKEEKVVAKEAPEMEPSTVPEEKVVAEPIEAHVKDIHKEETPKHDEKVTHEELHAHVTEIHESSKVDIQKVTNDELEKELVVEASTSQVTKEDLPKHETAHKTEDTNKLEEKQVDTKQIPSPLEVDHEEKADVPKEEKESKEATPEKEEDVGTCDLVEKPKSPIQEDSKPEESAPVSPTTPPKDVTAVVSELFPDKLSHILPTDEDEGHHEAPETDEGSPSESKLDLDSKTTEHADEKDLDDDYVPALRREVDITKIVTSVAHVLKSDAPLEELASEIPHEFSPYSSFGIKSYTTELRETHITTVDSPISESRNIVQDNKEIDANKVEDSKVEEPVCMKATTESFLEKEQHEASKHVEETPKSRVNDLIKDSNILMESTSKIISGIKASSPDKEEIEGDQFDNDPGIVHRMLVTASSEDGGEEIEICPQGSITFQKSDHSGKSTPDGLSPRLPPQEDIFNQAFEQKGKHLEEVAEALLDAKEKADEEQPEKDVLRSGKSTPAKEIRSGKSSPDLEKNYEKFMEEHPHVNDVPPEEIPNIDRKDSAKTISESLEGSKVPSIVSTPDDSDDEEGKLHKEEQKLETKVGQVISLSDKLEQMKKKVSALDGLLAKDDGDEADEMMVFSPKDSPESEKKELDDKPHDSLLEAEIEKDKVEEISASVVETGKITPEAKIDESAAAKHSMGYHSMSPELMREEKIDSKISSGKATPDFHETKKEEISGKSSPDLNKAPSIASSGKATPDSHIKEEANESPKDQSGKATPDVHLEHLSGKTTPEIKAPSVASSGKATPDSHIKEEAKDISGKATPDVHLEDLTEHKAQSVASSGKATPDSHLKEEAKEFLDISGTNTPEVYLQEVSQEKAPSVASSGKATPDSNLKETKEESQDISGKATPEVHLEEVTEHKAPSVASSGKATPDSHLKEAKEESKDISGKATPEVHLEEVTKHKVPSVSSSGKATPDSHLKETKEESQDISGKATPEVHLEELTEHKASSIASSGKATPDLHIKAESPKEESGKATPDIKVPTIADSGKATPELHIQEDVKESSGKATPEVHLETTSGKSSPDLKEQERKTSLEVVSHDTKELNGKETSDHKDTSELKITPISSGRVTPDLIVEDFDDEKHEVHILSGRGSPDFHSGTTEQKPEQGADTSAPEQKIDHSGKATPEVEEYKSGKSTPAPEEKVEAVNIVSGVTADDVKIISGVSSGRASPEHEHQDEKISGKSSPVVEDIMETVNIVSGVTADDVKIISGVSSGRASPTHEAHTEEKHSGKSSPVEEKLETVNIVSGVTAGDVKIISGVSSGKITPEPEIHDDKHDTDHETHEENKHSGKSSPVQEKLDTINIVSGVTADDVKIISGVSSGRASPDHETNAEDKQSGKTSPSEEKLDTVNIVSRVTADDIKIISGVSSGKATPEPETHDDKHSGKSTPDVKTSEPETKESSGKASPELLGTKSGKSTPDHHEESVLMVAGVTLDQTKIITGVSSGKATPEPSREHISGKATPDIKEDVKSGKATPDVKDEIKSGKSTPEKPDEKQEVESIPIVSGVTAGDIKIISGVSSGHATPEPTKDILSPAKLSGKSTPDIKDDHQSPEATKDQGSRKESVGSEVKLSGKSTPDLKLEHDILDTHIEHGLRKESLGSNLSDARISGKSTPDRDHHTLESIQDGHDSRKESWGSDGKREMAEYIRSQELSGHSTPEPELKFSEKSGKSTPDIKGDKILSGKSTPEPTTDIKSPTLCTKTPEPEKSGKTTPDVHDVHEKSSILSGKATPEVETKLSDKASPVPQDVHEKLSGKVTPEVHDVHGKPSVSEVDTKLSDKASPVPPFSGKATPDSHGVHEKSSVLSGKTTPEVDTKLSDKVSPVPQGDHEHEKLSGKATPEPKLSGKATPDLGHDIHDQSGALSGKATPEVEPKNSDKSGKSTPDTKASEPISPVRSIPEPETPEMETKSSDKSGHSTPEPIHYIHTDHVKIISGVTQSNISIVTGIRNTSDIPLSGKQSPEHKDIHEISEHVPDIKCTETTEEKVSGKSSPFVETEKTEDHIDVKAEHSARSTPEVPHSGKTTPDIKVSCEPNEPKSDSGKSSPKVESSEKSSPDGYDQEGYGINIVSGVTTSNVKIISGVSYAFGSDQTEKSESKGSIPDTKSSNTETSSLSIAGPSTRDDQTGPTSPVNKDVAKLSTEDLHLSGKSTPDIADVERIKEMHEILKHEQHIPGSSTPPTVPVSPIVKEFIHSEEKKELLKENISEKTIQEEVISSSVTKTSDSEVVKVEKVEKEEIAKVTTTVIDSGEITTSVTTIKTSELRCPTPGSDEEVGVSSPHSDISSGQMSRAAHPWGHESSEERQADSEDDDVPESPLSTSSRRATSPPGQFDNEDEVGTAHGITHKTIVQDPMNTSFYGALPDEHFTAHKVEEDIVQTTCSKSDKRFLDDADLDFDKAMKEHRLARGTDLVPETSTYKFEQKHEIYTNGKSDTEDMNGLQMHEISKNGIDPLDHPSPLKTKMSTDSPKKVVDVMTSSFIQESSSSSTSQTQSTSDPKKQDPLESWGKPLGLPSPALPPSEISERTQTTPKKMPPSATLAAKNKYNDERKRSESPLKYDKKNKKINPVYMDLCYVPHHGNSYYSSVDFFKRVRARYYVFSGTEPSKEVYNALLEAKQTWEDKELEVTIIPTYDTDVLGYWVAENEDLLAKCKIDLSPSASRCTINLQDHETSCSAYRLEF